MNITFINHACYTIETEDHLVMFDPWFSGKVFNNSWALIKDTNIDFFMFDILNDNLDILFQQIYKKYDNIDFLINGAGVNSATPLLSIQNEEINEIFEINFNFVVKCCQLYI